MFEHIWIEESCSWIVAPPDRLPVASDLEKEELFFVWGFLMDPRFLRGVTGREVPMAPAVIHGFRREVVIQEGDRGFRLVPEKGGVVMGVVLIGPTPEEVDALDRFEQVPHVMVRRKIDVNVGDLTREANIYLAA